MPLLLGFMNLILWDKNFLCSHVHVFVRKCIQEISANFSMHIHARLESRLHLALRNYFILMEYINAFVNVIQCCDTGSGCYFTLISCYREPLAF